MVDVRVASYPKITSSYNKIDSVAREVENSYQIIPFTIPVMSTGDTADFADCIKSNADALNGVSDSIGQEIVSVNATYGSITGAVTAAAFTASGTTITLTTAELTEVAIAGTVLLG